MQEAQNKPKTAMDDDQSMLNVIARALIKRRERIAEGGDNSDEDLDWESDDW